MRYYNEGDLIYIFGFSRGAYTARFLAEMVYSIGLLSRGNEEMVQFAWNTFSRYQCIRYNSPQSKKDKESVQYMNKFKATFCRPDIEVYFLGLFDCVNSVAQFEAPMLRKSYKYAPAVPPAKHIRHAVSIHERRLKFKPALFLLDGKPLPGVQHSDVKEVWFAGNHGDVGGGWGLDKNQRRLLSDTPLDWMLKELKTIPAENRVALSRWPEDDISLSNRLQPQASPVQELQNPTSRPHDMLAFGRGASLFGTVQWWMIEFLPFIARLELENGNWVARYWPPNMGSQRDIPKTAVIHPTVHDMLRVGVLSPAQMPKLGGHKSEWEALLSQQHEERSSSAEEPSAFAEQRGKGHKKVEDLGV